MYFTKSVLEQLRITLDKKFFWGLIVIKRCEFLKLFLHLNSEVWDAIWVWIHSNVEGIHSSFPWIHSLVKEFRLRQVFPYCLVRRKIFIYFLSAPSDSELILCEKDQNIGCSGLWLLNMGDVDDMSSDHHQS